MKEKKSLDAVRIRCEMDNFTNDEISYFLMINGMRHINMQNIFSLRTLHNFY